MEPAEVIDALKTALAVVKTEGQTTVTVDALERYLEGLRKDAGQSAEIRRLEYQRTLASYDAETKHSIEMFKSVIEAGREALNALVLINGGAVVALLGFMGATISKGLPPALGASLTSPLLQFGFGVLMGALGFGARYFSQAFYSGKKRKAGIAFTLVAIGFAFVGYTLFGFGIYGAFSAFTTQFAL
ncbi:MAG: hypothetical protein ACYC6S_02735 [Desulfobulbia bacterium]